jgi:hypothetical protein
MLVLGLMIPVGLTATATSAHATSMPFHEYNMCSNRCVNTTHEYAQYQAANRVLSEVQDGSPPFGVILEEVCSTVANYLSGSMLSLGFTMTTSNPDAQDGEPRRLLCVSSNAYILFAACGTHTAIDSPTSEGPKDAQLDQFLYLSTASYSVGKAIGGDLNDTVDESHLDGYYNGSWEADQSNRTNPQNTVGGSNPKKIDYVFADKSHFPSTRSLVVLTSNPASDHYYLKAYFNI